MTLSRCGSILVLSRRLAIVGLAGTIGACSPAATNAPTTSAASATAPAEPDALRVVATSTVLADLVRSVGGPKVLVASLVPKGGEVHTYDPSPQDLARLSDAQLVVMNGLGLDEWLVDQVLESGSQAEIVELAEDLQGVTYLEGGEEEAGAGEPGAEDHEGEEFNPHLWLDVDYARKYAARIAEALAEVDPADAAAYDAGLRAYDARLAELDASITAQIGALPEANRRIVSFHEAYPYYAAAYGLEIVGVIVEAPGQDPSAGEIAALIEAIRAAGVRAIFAEAQFSPQLAEAVAAETAARVVSDLYNDSLGDPPIDTYEQMMRWNTTKTVEALR